MPTRWIAIVVGLVAAVGNCQAKELRFVTEDFPPFTYGSATTDTEARAVGPFVEIIEAVCARMEVDCPVQLLPWRRALALAEAGEVDGIFTVIRSPDRERAFHLTRMLVTSRYGVYAHSASRFVFHHPEDLEGRSIAVYGPSGTSFVLGQHLAEVGDVTLVLEADNRRLLRMLEAGGAGFLDASLHQSGALPGIFAESFDAYTRLSRRQRSGIPEVSPRTSRSSPTRNREADRPWTPPRKCPRPSFCSPYSFQR